MQRKLHLLIAAGGFAALAASGSTLAQSSNIPNQPADVKSTLSGDGSSNDKATSQKQKADSKLQDLQPQSPNSPISVTPPSADNNNTTSLGATAGPAGANAAAGPNGVSANANVNGQGTGDSGKSGSKSKGSKSSMSDSAATQSLSESSTRLTGKQAPKPEDLARNLKSRTGQDTESATQDRR